MHEPMAAEVGRILLADQPIRHPPYRSSLDGTLHLDAIDSARLIGHALRSALTHQADIRKRTAQRERERVAAERAYGHVGRRTHQIIGQAADDKRI